MGDDSEGSGSGPFLGSIPEFDSSRLRKNR